MLSSNSTVFALVSHASVDGILSVVVGGWVGDPEGIKERRHFGCDDLMTRRVQISVRKSRVKKDPIQGKM